MLPFLREHGAEDWHQRRFITAVGGEGGLGFGQGAENDVGECLGERDGFEEGGDREVVFAGRDGGLLGALEDTVHAEGM